ncbi:MAG: flagellar biosynthesis protein FlhB [Proteobacteria bacterium]|nr:flagellar biosynthesis protein FlhB [Pseudomonadota bacterium]
MADTDSDADKSESPTQKKIEEARKKGQIAQSREVLNWSVLLAGALGLATLLPSASGEIARTLKAFIEKPHALPADGPGLGALLYATLGQVGTALAPMAAVMVLIVVLVALGQTGFVFSLEAVRPKFSKLSPAQGIKRLVSTRNLVEFAKAMLKLVLVSGVLYLMIRPELATLPGLVDLEVPRLLARLYELTVKLFLGVVAFMTVVALADFLYQKYEFTKSLRMTKTEIKDEYKQTEGDPKVKGRIRQIRIERARQRMMQAVPTADVVITNPTHFAVALAYDIEAMAAPRLVAKGADFVAQKIREVAEAHEVPIVENAPLARALYAGVELDQEIPVEHYKAVAEVIGYVYRLKGKIPA